MVRLPDLLYVALFALAWPLFDYVVLWPRFLRRARSDPDPARWQIWVTTLLQQWGLVALGVVLFATHHRSFSELGLRAPAGWRLWSSVLFVIAIAAYYGFAASRVAGSTAAQANVRKQLGQLTLLLPHNVRQLPGFAALSLTAGFCEEFLYRGYLIWALTPALGWGVAAAVSAPLFGLAHAYQGWGGIVRTGLGGVFFVAVVRIFDSLYPAIALHALIDLAAGLIGWLSLRAARAAG